MTFATFLVSGLAGFILYNILINLLSPIYGSVISLLLGGLIFAVVPCLLPKLKPTYTRTMTPIECHLMVNKNEFLSDVINAFSLGLAFPILVKVFVILILLIFQLLSLFIVAVTPW